MASVREVPREIPMADPGVKSLNLVLIQSGVTISGLENLVMMLLTGTRSFSSGFISRSGYRFPSGATLPAARYLGIRIHWLFGSSPSSNL